MANEKETAPREFRSLAEVEFEYFPELDAEKTIAAAAPRQVGVRLAREALAEITRKPADVPKARENA